MSIVLTRQLTAITQESQIVFDLRDQKLGISKNFAAAAAAATAAATASATAAATATAAVGRSPITVELDLV